MSKVRKLLERVVQCMIYDERAVDGETGWNLEVDGSRVLAEKGAQIDNANN